MSDINQVVLVGRLTRDAELRYTNSGMAVSKFAIAVNRVKRSGDQRETETSFFDCTMFGKIAESLNQYMTKGKQLAVTGELRQSRWESDGQSRSKVEVVVNNIQLLGGRSAGNNQGGGYSNSYNNNPAPQQQQQQNTYNQPSTIDDNFEDDIPF